MEPKRQLNITPTASDLTDQPRIKCMMLDCTSTFQNNSTLNFHMTKHHRIHFDSAIDKRSDVRYFCPQPNCKYHLLHGGKNDTLFFASKKYLRQHYLKVHSAKDIGCGKCDKKFASKALLQQHERSCGLVFKCGVCDWAYSSRECLLTHCRRKGHQFPDSLKCSAKSKKTDVIPVTTDPNVRLREKSSTNPSKWVRIAPDLRNMNKVTPNTPKVLKPDVLLKSLKEESQKHHVKLKEQSKISQMTQTASLYNVNCSKLSKLDSIATQSKLVRAKITDVKLSETKVNEKYKNLELIDEESSTIISNSSQTYRNLNNLNFVEDESTLNYFGTESFGAGICHIETQTELAAFGGNENNDCSRDMDPLLYSHTHTQTCDDILSELGLNTIHTQTNWTEEDYNDLFVSTETQTCFPLLMMDNISTQTQTMDVRRGVGEERATSDHSISNQCTQTQQTDYW